MTFSFAESESDVNAESGENAELFRITNAVVPTIGGMETEPRDSAVTEYVRMRLRKLKDDGVLGKEIAARAGVSAALVSQVIGGTHGVAKRSLSGWARCLGFKTPNDLRDAAYGWYRENVRGAAPLVSDPAVRKTMDILVAGSQATEEQLLAILSAYGTHERWQGRDVTFWLSQLGTELQRDRQIAREVHAEMRAGERDARAEKTKVQRAFREGHNLRKRVKEEQGDGAPPTSTRFAADAAVTTRPLRRVR